MDRLGLLRLVLAVGVVVLQIGCTRENGAAAAQRLTVVGSSTIAPLMGELAKQFEATHPGVRVDVQAGGTSRGLLEVRQGTAQIGMVSRALKADEADVSSVLIARDGLGIIVHRSNPLQQIGREQIIGIFSGKLKNWQQLGGPDLPITVVSKAEGRSTLEIFSAHFGLPYRDLRAQVVIGDNQQGIQTVAGAPGAIGYVSIGAAEYESQQGAAVKLLTFDGHVPSTAQVAAGTYPITRELNLVFKPPVTPATQALLDAARSPEAAALIKAQFFVPPALP
jgi:phosphate transport system substrate-binding protein